MKQFKHLIKPYIIWASILIVVPFDPDRALCITQMEIEVLTLHFTWANLQNFWKLHI